MIIIHDDIGTTYGPRAYIGSVNRMKRIKSEDEAYAIGKRKPNYPMPALADTNTVMCLGYLSHAKRMQLALDGIWRNDLVDVPICY